MAGRKNMGAHIHFFCCCKNMVSLSVWLGFHFFYFSFPIAQICIFSGLVTVWYGCNTLVAFFMNRKWFTWLSAFAFIIYALHVPLVNYCTRIVFTYFSGLPNLRLLTFVVLPLLIIACCVLWAPYSEVCFQKYMHLPPVAGDWGEKTFPCNQRVIILKF